MPLICIVGNETNMTFLANDDDPSEQIIVCHKYLGFLHQTSTVEFTMVSIIMRAKFNQFIAIISKLAY